MFLSLSFSVAMETKIIFLNIHNYQNINILTNIIREHCSELNLLQLSHSMFCKNIAHLAVARGHHTQQPLNDAPQQRLNEQYSYRTYCGKVVINLILRSECPHVALPINTENDVRACSSCVKSQSRIRCVFLCLYKKVHFISLGLC